MCYNINMTRPALNYTAPVGALVRIKSYGTAHEVMIGQIDPGDPDNDVLCVVTSGKIAMIVGTYYRDDGKHMPIVIVDNIHGWIFQDEYEVIDAL